MTKIFSMMISMLDWDKILFVREQSLAHHIRPVQLLRYMNSVHKILRDVRTKANVTLFTKSGTFCIKNEWGPLAVLGMSIMKEKCSVARIIARHASLTLCFTTNDFVDMCWRLVKIYQYNLSRRKMPPNISRVYIPA